MRSGGKAGARRASALLMSALLAFSTCPVEAMAQEQDDGETESPVLLVDDANETTDEIGDLAQELPPSDPAQDELPMEEEPQVESIDVKEQTDEVTVEDENAEGDEQSLSVMSDSTNYYFEKESSGEQDDHNAQVKVLGVSQGTVTYDAATKTLRLNNVMCYSIKSSHDLTIELVGTIVIDSIEVNGVLTITGKGTLQPLEFTAYLKCTQFVLKGGTICGDINLHLRRTNDGPTTANIVGGKIKGSIGVYDLEESMSGSSVSRKSSGGTLTMSGGSVSRGISCGTFTMAGGSVNGGISCGTLTMSDGNVSGSISCGPFTMTGGSVSGRISCGTLTMAGGSVSCRGTGSYDSTRAIYCDTMLLKKGTVNGRIDCKKIAMTDGRVNGGISCKALTMDGGSVSYEGTRDNYGTTVLSCTKLTMKGGSIEASRCYRAVLCNKMTMAGGTIRANDCDYGVSASGIVIKKGNIVVTNPSYEGISVKNGNFTMSGGNVTVKDSYKHAIRVSSYTYRDKHYGGKVKIAGGKLVATTRKTSSGSYSWAIYADSITNKPSSLKKIVGRLSNGARFLSGGTIYQITDARNVNVFRYDSKKTEAEFKAVEFGKCKYSVRGVAAKAFKTKRGAALTSITFHNSIRSFGANAFKGTKSLRILAFRRGFSDVYTSRSGSKYKLKVDKQCFKCNKKAFSGAGAGGGSELTVTVRDNAKAARLYRNFLRTKGLPANAKVTATYF